MFNDFITINGHHTFKKSEVQGIEAFYKRDNSHFLILYFIVSGNKIEVDREYVNSTYIKEDSYVSGNKYEYLSDENRDIALAEYHDKWFKKLSIGNEIKEIKEKVMI